MIVLAFPPKLSLSNHVRMESLYGMNIFFLECCNLSEASAVKKVHKYHFQAIYVKSFEYTPSFNILAVWYHIPKVDIIFPSVTSDLLILPPSFNLSPVAPEASTLSLAN